MVLPDGSHTAKETRRGGLRSFAVASVVLAIAATTSVLGSLTTPRETAAETTFATVAVPEQTTTTPPFDVSQIARGSPLDLSRTFLNPTSWPIAMVDYNDRLFVFGSTGFVVNHGQRGLRGWVSPDDGESWLPLGAVIAEDFGVTDVVSTAAGLVAVGMGPEGRPMAWSSTDGTRWTPANLPTDPAKPRGYIYQAHASDDLITVFGQAEPPIGELDIEAAVLAAAGVEELPYGWSWYGTGSPIIINGPAGLVVGTIPVEELGIDVNTLALYFYGGGGGGELQAWSSRDGVNWTVADTPFPHFQDLVTGGNEEIQVVMGDRVWSTDDGSTWSEGSVGILEGVILDVGDHYVGIQYQGVLGSILRRSDDLEEWVEIPIPGRWDPPRMWYTQHTAARGGALAFIAATDTVDRDLDATRTTEPVVVERNGYELAIGDEASLVVSDGDNQVLLVPRWSQNVSEWIEADVRTETITFLHPKTGQDLMTLTFEEIDSAESQFYASQIEDSEVLSHTGLFFTSDEAEWTIQELDLPPDAYPDSLLITDDSVSILVQVDAGAWPQAPRIEIWRAALPDS